MKRLRAEDKMREQVDMGYACVQCKGDMGPMEPYDIGPVGQRFIHPQCKAIETVFKCPDCEARDPAHALGAQPGDEIRAMCDKHVIEWARESAPALLRAEQRLEHATTLYDLKESEWRTSLHAMAAERAGLRARHEEAAIGWAETQVKLDHALDRIEELEGQVKRLGMAIIGIEAV